MTLVVVIQTVVLWHLFLLWRVGKQTAVLGIKEISGFQPYWTRTFNTAQCFACANIILLCWSIKLDLRIVNSDSLVFPFHFTPSGERDRKHSLLSLLCVWFAKDTTPLASSPGSAAYLRLSVLVLWLWNTYMFDLCYHVSVTVITPPIISFCTFDCSKQWQQKQQEQRFDIDHCVSILIQ